MDLTIIIPVYNREKVVGNTLQCVASQTMRPLRLILVDNNSSDGSLQALRDFKAANQSDDFQITILSETTPGAPAARNCGLHAATTEWVMFFDSDDLMAPDLLESYSRALDANPDAEVIVTRMALKDASGTRPVAYFENDFFANHIINSSLSTQRYIARRQRFIAAGEWNADLQGWNDWELGIRLLLSQPRIAFTDHTIRVTAVHQEESITGVDFHSKRGIWECALDAAEAAIAASQHPQRKRLLFIVDYRRVVLAAHYRKEGEHEIADKLYRSVLRRYQQQTVRRITLAAAYHYISRGGRGFGRLLTALF